VPKTIEAELTPPPRGMEILAKMNKSASAQPVSAQDDSSAETLFVVMRTGQFGPSGASWTIRVWRFTVLKPEQIPVGLKVPAKST
jgi:hypothetical protein